MKAVLILFAVTFAAALYQNKPHANDLSGAVPEPSMVKIDQHFEAIVADSGYIEAPRAEKNELVTIWETVVKSPRATWMKLEFSAAELGYRLNGHGPFLKITSLLDSYVQYLDRVSIQEWYFTSAYFNGDSVKVELITRTNLLAKGRIAIKGALVGEPGPDDVPAKAICDGIDRREYCTEQKSARYIGIGGCTGWIFNDRFGCFGTAGHCGVNDQGSGTIQFNVPLSNSNGAINHPPPEDQFAVDSESVQLHSGGVGNDWGYFGVFVNSNTGLSAIQHVNYYTYHLADQAPPSSNTIAVHIAGYGTCMAAYRTGACESLTYSQVNKNHTYVGSYELSETTLLYRTDTTGGNSGSGVEVVYNYDQDPSTWVHVAIGIHTHGGCPRGNYGTAVQHPAWTAARHNPRGVCATGPDNTLLRNLMKQELNL